MKIWVTRHGQTDLNAQKLMQGRSDVPLNETGRAQAKAARELIGDVKFDAVYASPLDRAIETASIIGGVDRSKIIIDERIIETDFGKYEQKPYATMGLPMNLYWMLPEVFPAPPTVETTDQMIERVRSFFTELEAQDHENVLVACHGGIIRVIRGYLEDVRRGYVWRPRPKNCEIRVYESVNGKHTFLDQKVI
ncbi:phosphoglycerate mutase family protein [Butyrivibrio proteoclasticus B316]|uniref:Phosphoglycerate mutase family protein n=1 Tax=Butyrivibrio proteoclasticus (strain ATCC 51982 / DSM 14932 / B316) TaxID=515622 RepID=E0RXZ3_BUTPB|nr:histidine phosphatase family protein [Butyrivibrio proteoclasticus]ADL34719.1 phosphoglycerate mutase family protein [Butyrivibrio proteoclasticus B316]